MNFKEKAHLHQLSFFSEEDRKLSDSERKNPGRAQAHWLNNKATSEGKIFYDEYGIFQAAIDWRKGKTNTPEWFKDTLRSQHIPFNFFIPLVKEKELGIKVFGELFNIEITDFRVEIEFPPKKLNPLGDNTSFDAFIEYDYAGGKGIIGIETKYTEGGYSPTSKELELVNDPDSVYYKETRRSGLYLESSYEELKKNSYRQIWRNHLLACVFGGGMYRKFLSATFYPEGNSHFVKTIGKFMNFLTDDGKDTLVGITFEEYFNALQKYAVSRDQRNWIDYLLKRYLVDELA